MWEKERINAGKNCERARKKRSEHSHEVHPTMKKKPHKKKKAKSNRFSGINEK